MTTQHAQANRPLTEWERDRVELAEKMWKFAVENQQEISDGEFEADIMESSPGDWENAKSSLLTNAVISKAVRALACSVSADNYTVIMAQLGSADAMAAVNESREYVKYAASLLIRCCRNIITEWLVQIPAENFKNLLAELERLSVANYATQLRWFGLSEFIN